MLNGQEEKLNKTKPADSDDTVNLVRTVSTLGARTVIPEKRCEYILSIPRVVIIILKTTTVKTEIQN